MGGPSFAGRRLPLGGYLGLDTRAVVRFGEAVSGLRWRQCRRDDLERVLADFAQLADRVMLMDIEPTRLAKHPERPV